MRPGFAAAERGTERTRPGRLWDYVEAGWGGGSLQRSEGQVGSITQATLFIHPKKDMLEMQPYHRLVALATGCLLSNPEYSMVLLASCCCYSK